jgi:methyl-accepting chemotaxis protein
MNAKDTLKKIAEALNIVSDDAKEVVSDAIDSTQDAVENVAEAVLETVEDVVETATDVKEAIVETVEDVKDSIVETVGDVVDSVGESIENVGEAIQETAKDIDATQEPNKDDSRVADLEKQLADLKEILSNAMKQEETPEVPVVEPKGLTHSPEKEVAKKAASGVGRKGTSIQERVFKYINNQ